MISLVAAAVFPLAESHADHNLYWLIELAVSLLYVWRQSLLEYSRLVFFLFELCWLLGFDFQLAESSCYMTKGLESHYLYSWQNRFLDCFLTNSIGFLSKKVSQCYRQFLFTISVIIAL